MTDFISTLMKPMLFAPNFLRVYVQFLVLIFKERREFQVTSENKSECIGRMSMPGLVKGELHSWAQ